MAEFDPKKANTNDWGVIGGGAAVLIASMLGWYGTSGGDIAGYSLNTSISGWSSGFLAVLGILLCIAAAAFTAYRVFAAAKLPDLPLTPNALVLALSGAGAVLILLRLITFDRRAVAGFSVGPKIGVFLALIGAAVMAYFAYRSFQTSGEKMAFDSSKMPKSAAATTAAPGVVPPPPAGFAPPPPAAAAAPSEHDGDDHSGHDHPHPH